MNRFRDSMVAGFRGVVITGPPGIGKTRLAHKAAATAGRPELLFIKATPSASQTPLGAFVPHLESTRHKHASATALLWSALHELRAFKRGVFVDDLNHLDPLSVALLDQFVRDAEGDAVLTIREGEEKPPEIAALLQDEILEYILLEPLTRRETRRLVNAALDGEVAEDTFEELWRLSQGNPLYLRLLTGGAIDSGSLITVDGTWLLASELSPDPKLDDLIWQTISSQGDSVADVCALFAVEEPLELALLLQLFQGRSARLAEKKRLMRVEEEGLRSIAYPVHPLYPQIASAHVGEIRLRDLSARLAHAIRETGMRRRDDQVRVSRLLLKAGSSIPLGIAEQAASDALSRFDAKLAERVLDSARRQSDSQPVRLLHARSLGLLGRIGEALEILEHDRGDASNDHELADSATLAIQILIFGGKAAEANQLAESIEDELTAPVPLARVRLSAAMVAVVMGSMDQAFEYGEAVLTTDELPDLVALETLVILTIAQPLVGKLRHIHDRIDEGLKIAHRDDAPPLARHQLKMNRLLTHLSMGQATRAYESAWRHYREVADTDGPVASVGMLLGDVLFERGQFERLISTYREALEAVERFDAFANRPHLALWGATFAYQLGNDALAHEWETRAADHSPDIRWELRRHRVDAWRMAISGDLEGTRVEYHQLFAAAQKRGFRLWGLLGLADAIRLRQPGLVVGYLEELAGQMEGETARLFLDHARALLGGEGPRLDQVAGRYADLGWHLRAAEACADAARSHQASGESVASHRSAFRSNLVSTGFAYLTPPLRDVPESLTAREAEVAQLASTGLANQEIADQLYMSIRTVENHLSRVYRKLGISGRTVLAALVAETREVVG